MYPKQERDWEMVANCLHWEGKHYEKAVRYQFETRLLADGFGDLTRKKPHYTKDTWESMLWDWSHVRDSSHAAIAKMADYLRSKGFED